MSDAGTSGSGDRRAAFRSPIPQALTTHNLVAGCERTPFGLVAGAAAGLLSLAWQSWSVIALAGAATFFFGGLYALRRAAKNDPIAWQVYMRSRKYKSFYPARSTPFRER